MQAKKWIREIIMTSALLAASLAWAQEPPAEECVTNDAVVGVNWDINVATDGRVYIAGNGGVFKSCDSGTNWSKTASYQPPALSLTTLRSNPSVVLFGTSDSLYRSTDGGETFTEVGGNMGEFVWSIAEDSAGNLFAGGEQAIYRSIDGGSSWQAIPGSPAGHAIQALLVDRANDQVVFAGSNGGGFFVSTDGGNTWESKGNGNASWQIKELAQDPQNPAVLLAASWDGIWQSSDSGHTWMRLGSSRVVDITYLPAAPTTVFALSFDQGVIRSVDGGSNWMPVSAIAGVAPNKLYSIAALESGRLLVGTEFAGAFISDDSGATWSRSGTEPVDEPEPPAVPPSGDDAVLTTKIEYLGKGDSVKAGKDARFRVTVRNTGTGPSAPVSMSFSWFRSPAFGENEPFAYSISTTQGRCARSVTPDPDCRLGVIPAGGSVTIEIGGATRSGTLGWYTLRARMGDERETRHLVGEFSLGSSVTVAKSGGSAGGGGGASDLSLLLFVCAALLWRAMRETGGQRNGGQTALSRETGVTRNGGPQKRGSDRTFSHPTCFAAYRSSQDELDA